MTIKFALGKVTTRRAGLKFIREGSGVQINIINKKEIDVKKSVVALMPNFIHSLDACNIHEITNFLHRLKIDEINDEIKNELGGKISHYGDSLNSKLKLEQEYLTEKYTYNPYEQNDNINKDNTFLDISLVRDVDLIKIGAFKKNIPLYTIHDCFATTPNNMELIKNYVTLLFSKMYFSTPYIRILHLSLLEQIMSSDDIYGYPLEFIRAETSSNEKNDKLIIKDFKKVNVVLDNIIKINSFFLDDKNNRNDIFDNKYYLFTIDKDNKKKRNLIPLFPPMINDNINKNRKTLEIRVPKSAYLIA